MSTIIIYETDSIDAFTAAWVVYTANPGAQIFEGRLGGPVPTLIVLEDVYILSMAYASAEMLTVDALATSLTVLEHHGSAEDDCRGLAFCTFDSDKSAAGLAWDTFFPTLSRPWFIDRIEDAELGTFALPETRDAIAYLTSLERTLPIWSTAMAEDPSVATTEGPAVTRSTDRYYQETAKEARLLPIGADPVIAVNAPNQNASEIADILIADARSAVYAMVYFQREDGKWQYLLRSDGTFDVSVIAVSFGGAGDVRSASFETDDLITDLL